MPDTSVRYQYDFCCFCLARRVPKLFRLSKILISKEFLFVGDFAMCIFHKKHTLTLKKLFGRQNGAREYVRCSKIMQNLTNYSLADNLKQTWICRRIIYKRYENLANIYKTSCPKWNFLITFSKIAH